MIRINLLPQRRRRRFIPESGVVLVALFVIGALAASYAWETWRNNRVAAETAQINQKLITVRRQVAEVLALEVKIEDLKARETLLKSLEAREVPWAEMLVDLADRTPHDAWLANASVSGSTATGLSLQGSGLSYDAVARFMTALTGSRFYSDVDLQAAQRSVTGGTPVVQFGLSLKMRPLPVPVARATPAAQESSR
ncbi:MAG TPA: PilN domain-containing protein [bacterium]|nr:PilN domain-containing protein [bacterium]